MWELTWCKADTVHPLGVDLQSGSNARTRSVGRDGERTGTWGEFLILIKIEAVYLSVEQIHPITTASTTFRYFAVEADSFITLQELKDEGRRLVVLDETSPVVLTADAHHSVQQK